MEGRWRSGTYAELNLIGQPNVEAPRAGQPGAPARAAQLHRLRLVLQRRAGAWTEFPRDQWPTNLELLYYGFHIMVGLGTLFIALMGLAALFLAWGRLQRTRPLLWALMLAFPFPFIANSAGWMVAEMGRQPWLVYGLMRTADGTSSLVHPGETVFTSLGFAGLYFVLGLLFLFLVGREVNHGPVGHARRSLWKCSGSGWSPSWSPSTR